METARMGEIDTAIFGAHDLAAALIGREAELAELHAAYEAVLTGAESRTITLVGENGSGKSRLIHEFVRQVRAGPLRVPRVYRGRARRRGNQRERATGDASYGVFARLLRARFGLVEGMTPDQAQQQVRDQVATALGDRKVGDVCHFLGQLIDLAFDESPLTQAVANDPLQARPILRAIVRRFFEGDASHGPVCLVFDDLHFADDDSIDLLNFLTHNLQAKLLLIYSARAEFLRQHDSWHKTGTDRHRVVELGPLSTEDSAELMHALLAPCEGDVPQALIDAGVKAASGNPGQLTQMVRAFHDSGVLEERDALSVKPVWRVDLKRLHSVRLPVTMEDAVGIRIAALAPKERRVLEHAAAMGNVFWLGGLLALRRMGLEPPEVWRDSDTSDADELKESLATLVQRDYVLELEGAAFRNETEYVFKQNLEREKIAGLTSAAASRRYHQTIADWLVQNANIRSQEEYAAVLAEHLEKAGSLTRSAFAYLEAGDIARQNYAARQASQYYAKGLELLGDDDARRRIDALHNHGDVLQLLGKIDEALAAFRQMLNIAYRLNLRAKGGAAHNRIGRLFRQTGSLDEAREHLEAGRLLFAAAEDVRGVASSHDDMGRLLWVKGEYEEALAEMRKALDMRREIGDRRSIALSLNNIGMVWMDFGQARKAKEALEAALAIRREVDDPIGIVQSLNTLGKLAQDQQAHSQALAHYREAYAVAQEIGERNRIATALANIGTAYQHMGNTEEAVRTLSQAVEACEELGDKLALASATRALAKAYLHAGELKHARSSIRQSVDLFGQVRSKPHLAIALRTLGEITGAGAWEGHEGKAVDYFMRSIAIFKETGNEFELAKSYQAFSDYVASSEHYRNNSDIQREAVKLKEIAKEIFERHRISAAET